jgi:hypothetical protein
MNRDYKRSIGGPPLIALAVAVSGVVGMLIVDHGPWNRPRVQIPDTVNFTSTDAAAQAVGATVTPTEPKSAVEPTAPGPKPAQPAIP